MRHRGCKAGGAFFLPMKLRLGLTLLAKGLALAALLGLTGARASAQVPYQFDVTTAYAFDVCDSYGHCAAPDTGYFTVTNNGSSTFTGTVGVVAVGTCAFGPFGPDESESVPGVTLNPGNSITIVLAGDTSNNCGFNGGNGAQIFLTGTVSNAFCSQSVDLRVYDRDIHSGVPHFNPCDGTTTDSYVLQGGAPSGCDNGDPDETNQAPGHYSFVQTSTVAISSLSASPNVLWPPNHKLVPVTVSATTNGGCGPVSCGIVGITSSEPDNGLGDGDTANDIQFAPGARTANLRAERSGTGSGRVYTITVRCTDALGTSTTGTVTVTVPHDQKK